MAEYNDERLSDAQIQDFDWSELERLLGEDSTEPDPATRQRTGVYGVMKVLNWVLGDCPINVKRHEYSKLKASASFRQEIRERFLEAMHKAVATDEHKSSEDIAADLCIEYVNKAIANHRAKGRNDALMEKAAEIYAGRRIIVFSWLVAPHLFGDETDASAHQVASALGIEGSAISPLIQDAVREFGVRNQFHAHDWKNDENKNHNDDQTTHEAQSHQERN